MRILFDHGVPVPLRHHLSNHVIATAYEMGWARLENGALLDSANDAFDLVITTDQSIRHQQTLAGRRLAVLVLPTTNWLKIRLHTAEITQAIDEVRAGELRELTF